MILCHVKVTRPGFLIGGFLIGSMGMLANTASAQQKWDAYLPQPVRVADVGELNGLGNEERPAAPKKDVKSYSRTTSRRNAPLPTSPTRANSMDDPSIGRASHLEPSASEIQPIDHDGRWVEMPQSDWSNVSRNPISAPYVAAPPHLVIESPRAAPAASHPIHAGQATSMGYQEPLHAGYAGVGPSGVGASHATPSVAANVHPHLPVFPGVENDPQSVGPGHLGMGTHWLKTRPQQRQTIPGATVAPTWKTPYSYGYFGSEGKRQWTRQHGYRDRYLQWTLR
ncbi:hypothetical protein [Aporhodopirellula aestuarii]|uniref:Secreted protein n=1 Tax=Aporhodopirellula aestuarii TaxID=2950107 RepID=A0ABT0UEF7_9BACT|nr:hypothetical protein [Aporhodopirellula aestuarii]MCM2375273.1 hypothetical protein [Aporhodopirellula aestuarii]